ncbi:lipopolysaccharide biosynthesis protein [Neobacillus endophyticus]|uniref:lipopolysaccharide biosynthesis protein n=1 Tax=Neobacillus endophyticus TaxID=2738405 RepID=UPI001FE2C07B|nr:hypothetical protein [Neobacillus endophyticus]
MSSYDFAVMGYYEAIGQLFIPIMNLSFYSFYMKDFFSRTDEENERIMAILIKFLSLINLGIIFVGTLLLLLYFQLAKVTFPIYPYAILTLFSLYFSVYSSFLGLQYKMNKEGLKFFAIQIINTILPIAFGLYLVIQLKLGAEGRMMGVLLTQFILAVLVFKMNFIKIKLDFNIIKKALSFGYPLIIIAFLDIPSLYIDRILLERLKDVNAFALYSIGLKLSGIVLMLGSAIYQAFEPDFYKFVSQKNKKGFIQISGFVYGFLLVVTILFSLCGKLIISLLTSNRYTGAYQFANLMVWSNFLLLFSYALTVILIVQNKTKLLLYRKIMIAVIGVACFITFIHYGGFIGACYAKIIINLLNSGILLYYIVVSRGGVKLIHQLRFKKVRKHHF